MANWEPRLLALLLVAWPAGPRVWLRGPDRCIGLAGAVHPTGTVAHAISNTARLMQEFDDLDRDRDGSISFQECTPLAQAVDVDGEEEFFQYLDKNSDRTICESEFLALFRQLGGDLDNLDDAGEQELQELLQKLQDLALQAQFIHPTGTVAHAISNTAAAPGVHRGALAVFWPAEGAVVRPGAPLAVGIRLLGTDPRRTDQGYYHVRITLAGAQWVSDTEHGGLQLSPLRPYESPYNVEVGLGLPGVASTTIVLPLPDLPENPGFYTVNITAICDRGGASERTFAATTFSWEVNAWYGTTLWGSALVRESMDKGGGTDGTLYGYSNLTQICCISRTQSSVPYSSKTLPRLYLNDIDSIPCCTSSIESMFRHVYEVRACLPPSYAGRRALPHATGVFEMLAARQVSPAPRAGSVQLLRLLRLLHLLPCRRRRCCQICVLLL